MTATTPKLGIVYPLPTDRVTDYPTAAQAGMTTIDTRLGRILAGTVTVSAAAAANTNTVVVNFAAGVFTTAPFVVAQCIGSSFWVAYLPVQVTTGGFSLAATSKSGAVGTVTNMNIHWHAISPLATP